MNEGMKQRSRGLESESYASRSTAASESYSLGAGSMNIRWLFIEGGSLIAPSTPLESGGRPLLDAMGVKERA